MFVFAYFHLNEDRVSSWRNIGDIETLFFKRQIDFFPGIGRVHMIIIQAIADFQAYHIDKLNYRRIMFYLERMR